MKLCVLGKRKFPKLASETQVSFVNEAPACCQIRVNLCKRDRHRLKTSREMFYEAELSIDILRTPEEDNFVLSAQSTL
jgi:hypothetical protein